MQFSIIVPIYNVRNYVESCIQSILNQTFQDFEIILVNDGSTDHVENVLFPYIKNNLNIHYIKKENGGLSEARNVGIKKAQGDYILFIDSDDVVHVQLLERLHTNILEHPNVDILKYQCCLLDEEGNTIKVQSEQAFPYQDMNQAFSQLLDSSTCELACLYAYRRSFWLEHNFTYALGKYHEDFGLTPYILVMAKDAIRMDFVGYHYLQRSGSIMNSTNKRKQRSEDMLYHFDRIYTAVNENPQISKAKKTVLYSFIANALISRAGLLKGNDLQNYIVELERRHVDRLLLQNTFPRKAKYFLFKINFKLGVRCFSKSN